jgi:hypothetical protein
MSPLPTPKLADLDDPLAPRREPAKGAPAAATRPATTQRRRATPRPQQPAAPVAAAPPSLAGDALVAVFARLPESLSDGLADAVRAVNAGRPRRGRVSQQDLLGAIVDRYITSDVGLPPGELGQLVDAYRARLRG